MQHLAMKYKCFVCFKSERIVWGEYFWVMVGVHLVSWAVDIVAVSACFSCRQSLAPFLSFSYFEQKKAKDQGGEFERDTEDAKPPNIRRVDRWIDHLSSTFLLFCLWIPSHILTCGFNKHWTTDCSCMGEPHTLQQQLSSQDVITATMFQRETAKQQHSVWSQSCASLRLRHVASLVHGTAQRTAIKWCLKVHEEATTLRYSWPLALHSNKGHCHIFHSSSYE